MTEKTEKIELTDVTLRDGIQMVPRVLTTSEKAALYSGLIDCGYSRLEVTSFVHPKWMPQFADSESFCEKIFSVQCKTELMAFVPNEKGMERLVAFPIPWVSTFIATSEEFNKKNINLSIAETLVTLEKIIKRARAAGRKVRVYISTVFGCPYQGPISNEQVLSLLKKIVALCPDEVALSDTIGVATPSQVREILDLSLPVVSKEKLALHFHNTYGMAVANASRAYELGIRKFDGSTGGVGGCPYAKGASGNVASEELVYYFFREQRAESFRLPAITKVLELLAEKLKISVRSHLYEILKKGATLYGIH